MEKNLHITILSYYLGMSRRLRNRARCEYGMQGPVRPNLSSVKLTHKAGK